MTGGAESTIKMEAVAWRLAETMLRAAWGTNGGLDVAISWDGVAYRLSSSPSHDFHPRCLC